jgi:sulfur dioxygenase
MYFRHLHDTDTGSMSYLLADLDAGEAVLVDPRAADLPVWQAMLDEHALRLKWLLRTHEHDDCLPGEAAALQALGVPCIQHRAPPTAQGAGVLVFGHEHLLALPTPGHTAGCLSYLWRDRLFCGGLLAVDACPYQPHPALPEALWDSVTRGVFTLPPETLLFTGHAAQARAVSTVHEVRQAHPWFAMASRDDFLARVQRRCPAPDGLQAAEAASAPPPAALLPAPPRH